MAYTYGKMSLNYASLLHTCFRHRLFSPTVARLDRRPDDDLITSARRADVSLPARPTHACTCYRKFPGNQGRGQPVWSRAAATAPYGTAGRLLIRGKIRLPKVKHPKFECHVTPNEDEYQKSVQLKFRYCLGIS